MKYDTPAFLVVDLFCGFGGVTLGFEKTDGLAKVIACINHDPKAIDSHWENHIDVEHYKEDIRTLNIYGATDIEQEDEKKQKPLYHLVNEYRELYPDAKLILWASLECTNFSKAKGGQPRDADSRTLANDLFRYQEALDPDYIMIENVVEFMCWGPLDEKGKPLSRKNGADWLKWRQQMCSYGYTDDWRELNSADFGAYTSRKRLFGIFAKEGLPISFPNATHSKKACNDMFGGLKPWMPVKDVLDFDDKGLSIFGRNKPLSDKTYERIYAGLIKFIAGGNDNFLAKIYAVASNSDGVYETESAAHTITTRDAHTLVQADFLVASNGGTPSAKVFNVLNPCRVITTADNKALVQPSFLHAYYGNGDNNHSTNNPSPTLTTKDRAALIQTETFIYRDFTSGDNNHSVENPAGALTSVPKMNLVKCEPYIVNTHYNNNPTSIHEPAKTITANRKWAYLINPSWGGNSGSVDKPSPVIIARQDKAPMYVVAAEQGKLAIPIYERDTEIVKKIKSFMAVYGIVDIYMRMLKIPELLKIQGFPADYKMVGNQSDKKKFIGNSVVPVIVTKWAEALAGELKDFVSKAA